MTSRRLLPAFAPLILIPLLALEAHARDFAVPEPLRPWKSWVLDRDPTHACPVKPDGTRFCVGYGSLDLDLGDKGGTFTLSAAVFGKQWVILPGGEEAWPKEVRSRTGDVPVVLRGGQPQAQLPAGEHALTGRLEWSDMPGSLAIPREAARIGLRLRGKAVVKAEADGSGNLLLESRAARPDSAEEGSPLTVRVYRKLVDGIPIRLITQVSLSASGADREILTGRLLPAGSAVLSIQADIPVRVEADGRLRAQVPAGDRSLTVESRWLEPVGAAAMERQDSLWPEEEIWTFEARRDIRVVELAGAPLIDPSQSGLPEEWKSLPAYRLAPGDTLRLVEKQRGDPSPQAGNLRLRRSLWLDFSGDAFTRKDVLAGTLYRRTRLEMRPGSELGRAELDGNPVMITALEGIAGVEVPAGGLNLTALSRATRHGGGREATGWNLGFQGMDAILNLPPGWRLIHAEGPDRVGDSWISDWTLWDIFLLCILTLASFRLIGWRGALLAFATFVLLSQEPGLDGLLWLNLLAAVGLVKVLPEGNLRKVAGLYRWASLALLVILWIPFAVVHARKALYPQLDGPGGSAFSYSNTHMLDNSPRYSDGQDYAERALASPSAILMKGENVQEQADIPTMGEGPVEQEARADLRPRKSSGSKRKGRLNNYLDSRTMQYAKVQTGPGEPSWGWESASFSWSGPVAADEDLRLVLMPPWLTRISRASQALLPGLLLLLLGLLARGGAGPGFRLPGFRFGKASATLWVLSAVSVLATPARAEFPSAELLKELEQKLSAPPDCAPSCAILGTGLVRLSGDRLRMELVYDAADTAVAALPGAGEDQWTLEALRLDGRDVAAAVRGDNGFSLVIPRGRHRVSVEARLLGNRLELVFQDKGRNLSVEAPGYSVQGLNDGRAGNGSLVFVRREAGEGPRESRRALLPDPAPPFVEVQRTLVLAQEWSLETKVIRIAPTEGPFSVEIALLPFEHPLAASMAKDRGKTLVSFADGAEEVSWRSSVNRQEELVLQAGALAAWSEVWQVQATSRWHLETAGLAPSQSQPEMGQTTLWHPIPGDSLAVRVTEPQAALGAVKTIESATLRYTPGRREASGTLHLRYRAGQGDAARLVLPDGATLENLNVNGKPQPLTQREGTLVLPLQPGLQEVDLGWKQAAPLRALQRTPMVIPGDPSANISVTLSVPRDRWVLFVGGPSAGPALLLWGVLVVLVILAYALGRSKATPLGFLDWTLLFIGTSTVNVYAAAPLLVLFLALRWRERQIAVVSNGVHNMIQVLLVLLALVAFGLLLASVPQALLSSPDMQITGNGSHGGELRWFLDRADGALPTGWMFSAPLWAYRVAMLLWSLWMAFRLLRWLKWCWERFSAGGAWLDYGKTKPAKTEGKTGQ